MAHDTHASTDHHDGEAHPHPALPPVTDEAPDSPAWLPVTGLALLTLLVLFALYRGASGGDAADAVGADEAAEAAGAAAAEGDAPIRAGEPGAVPVPAPAH